jgi:hypothetical protein
MPSWLTKPTVHVPLFVSRTRLEKRRQPGVFRDLLPVATTDWAMDSGGFWEITHRGGWTFTARQYAVEIQRARDEIGRMSWASPMDWMCEPDALRKTGLTVQQHQRNTVDNYLKLLTLDATLPVVPVLQGFASDDYLRCVDMYDAAGVDLTRERVVGLGSVCRRQATSEIAEITGLLSGLGLRLHGYGVKHEGLAKYARNLVSADSLAWSQAGRFEGNKRRLTGRGPGCLHHTNPLKEPPLNEGNCLPYALNWRNGVAAKLAAA